MAVRTVAGDRLPGLLADPSDLAPGDVVVVDGLPALSALAGGTPSPGTLPCIVVGRDSWGDLPLAAATGTPGDTWGEGLEVAAGHDVHRGTAGPEPGDPRLGMVDVVADGDACEAVIGAAARHPLAATALAVHLRDAARRSVAGGLVAESALYSALQAGPEAAAWRAAHPPRSRPAPTGPAVRVERTGDELQITLARPAVRNALGVQVRDGLLDALAVARADPRLRVVLAGDGSAFCAGGDLDEFGTFPDPATAHLVRLARSIGAALAEIGDRVTARVHGPCRGSGVELPAFCGRVEAAADATFALPELDLGLVPGAGGTVSLPRRIGRHRTAWLALTGRALDAPTARDWGLVDTIDPPTAQD